MRSPGRGRRGTPSIQRAAGVGLGFRFASIATRGGAVPLDAWTARPTDGARASAKLRHWTSEELVPSHRAGHRRYYSAAVARALLLAQMTSQQLAALTRCVAAATRVAALP